MGKTEILNIIQTIFREVFDNELIVVTTETVAEDIEEWDSLSHIQLIVAIERAFNIKLMSKEIFSWDDVGEMIDSIQQKLD